ncbi:MAG: type IV secretory system conjugative DNA transfer family protein [Flavobacteriales bacterium]|nr:type IV secretory system conjugative DNA transfer family protein [Flavobacteriales bacterium]
MISAITELITALFKVLGEVFSLLFDLFSKDHKLKASFASERSILKKQNTGFRITGRKALSRHLSYRNCLVSGVTGRGKTSISIIPSILKLNCSQVIHDPSGELFEKTAGALKEQEYLIVQINFNKATGHFFNPFLRAKTKAEINQLATLLAQGDEKRKGDAFFEQKAIELLSTFIRILKTQETTYQNGYNLSYLLDLYQAKDPKIDELFAEFADESLHTKFLSFVGTPDKTLGSIVASAQAYLQIFSLDETVAYITSKDTINIDLRSQKTALFIHSSIPRMKYYANISSIFIEQLFAEVFKELPKKEDQDIFFILDEAPILKLNLDVYCSNIRKYRGGIMIITQDAKSQLRTQYGAERAQTIISNCYTRMYMGAEMESALELERILGNYEYADKKNKLVLHKRCLRSVDEILSMNERNALIISSGKKPVKAKLRPYYKIPKLRKLTEIEYETTDGVETVIEVPLLPFQSNVEPSILPLETEDPTMPNKNNNPLNLE